MLIVDFVSFFGFYLCLKLFDLIFFGQTTSLKLLELLSQLIILRNNIITILLKLLGFLFELGDVLLKFKIILFEISLGSSARIGKLAHLFIGFSLECFEFVLILSQFEL